MNAALWMDATMNHHAPLSAAPSRPGRQPRAFVRAGLTRIARAFRLWVALGLAALLPLCGQAEPADTNVFRISVSYASFGTVSRNDASAALKAWAMAVVKERNLNVRFQVEVQDDERQFHQALTLHQLDAANMTTAEFVNVAAKPETVLLPARGETIGERYVLLTHRGSGIADLAALKGRKLIRHVSPRTSLAIPWLETVLADRGLGSTARFLGELTPNDSPSKSVLRVFFRQSDACLVTTNAFALACELNPQVGRDLRVLACSPDLIPSVLFFRPDYTGAERDEIEAAILNLHITPAGAQVLTVYQGDRMAKVPVSRLETTLQLVAKFNRLRDAGSLVEPPAGSTAQPTQPK